MTFMNRVTMLAVSALLAVLPAAYAAEPVALNIFEKNQLAAGKSYSANDLKGAIQRAAEKRQWKIVSDAPGKIRVKQEARNGEVQLVIDISYAGNSLSVKYVSSTGFELPNTGGKKMIEARYESWVSKLIKEITTQLGS